MSRLEQDYRINAPVGEVWKALTDAEIMAKWSGDSAQSDPREGGVFSLWNDDIHGTFTKLVPDETIEQDWFGHENPTWRYHVSFSLSPGVDGTSVHMIYDGDIVNRQKDIDDWRDYYFNPIKKLLEK